MLWSHRFCYHTLLMDRCQKCQQDKRAVECTLLPWKWWNLEIIHFSLPSAFSFSVRKAGKVQLLKQGHVCGSKLQRTVAHVDCSTRFSRFSQRFRCKKLLELETSILFISASRVWKIELYQCFFPLLTAGIISCDLCQ